MILSNAVLVTLFTSLPSLVDGHAFMKIPTSRNQYAVQIGTSWEMKEGIPLAESTPQGLNHNLNICGREGALGNDYDLWLDSTGVPMPFVAQDTFTKGQVIDVNIVIKAHHMGHFEIKACAMGRDSTQECFDANPLEFMADVTHGMPKDKNNPVRAMLWGDGKDIMYKYKLPDNLAGDQVLLQYIYWTANNCNYEGYDEYYAAHDTPPTSSKNSWSPGIPNCKPQEQISLYRDERTTGAVDGVELFFNCAEIAITGEPTPTPPVAPPSPRPPPPVPVPVQSPVQSPIEPGITGTCGQGDRGNGVCPDHSLCCSKWGHCGTDSGYCDDGSDNTTPTSPVPVPVERPTSLVGPGLPGPPDGNSNDACCSMDYKSCAGWGNDSKESCEVLGTMIWLENGAIDCNLHKDKSCTNTPTECCPGLVCVGNDNYKQCQADTQ